MAERVVTQAPTNRPPTQARPTPTVKPKAPSAPSRVEEQAAEVTSTLEIVGAGLTVMSMMRGARARQAFEGAKTDIDRKKAAQAVNSCQVMQLDAAALQIHAEGTGVAIATVAQENAFVAALVDRLKLVNGVGSVAISVLPLVYQLMANHAPAQARDNMPPELMQIGVLPPNMLLEKLEAQNKAKMALAQAQILRERQKAERELQSVQEELSGNAAAV